MGVNPGESTSQCEKGSVGNLKPPDVDRRIPKGVQQLIVHGDMIEEERRRKLEAQKNFQKKLKN
jgi:hypothetical protein